MKITSPKALLHIEGAVALVVAVAGYTRLGASWWWFALLFLGPDVLMVGYLAGARTGSVLYNLAHTYATPFAVGVVGWLGHAHLLYPVALVWVAHIGFDRVLGYGLKYPTAFKDTHLNRV